MASFYDEDSPTSSKEEKNTKGTQTKGSTTHKSNKSQDSISTQLVHQKVHELGHKRYTNIDTTPSSSSYININKENTTIPSVDISDDQETIYGYSEEWNQIDTLPLRDLVVKFGSPQIKQLYEKSIKSPELESTADKVQESIHAFSYELELQKEGRLPEKKYYSGKLGYFMGILLKGREYNPPDGYESPSERALRENLEISLAKRDKQKEMLEKLKEVEFDNWYEGLSDSEISEKVHGYRPENKYKKATESAMRGIFAEEVFPGIKAKILKGESL